MKNKTGIILVAAILIITLFINPVAASKTKTLVITPGQSLGWVKIGSTNIQEILKEFGTRGLWNKKTMQLIYRQQYGIDFLFDKKTATVSSIMVKRSSSGGYAYHTKEGVKVGSPEKKVRKVFGIPSRTEKLTKANLLIYVFKDRFTAYVTDKSKVIMIWFGQKKDYRKFAPTIRAILEKE